MMDNRNDTPSDSSVSEPLASFAIESEPIASKEELQGYLSWMLSVGEPLSPAEE